jgi:hypothetical protein
LRRTYRLRHPQVVALLAAALFLECAPGDGTPSDDASSMGGSGGSSPYPVVPFGADCSTDRICAEGECRAIIDPYGKAEICDLSTCQGICSRACATQADCTGDTRCTTTPRGAMCLRKCESNARCDIGMVCARAGTDHVCWASSQPGGEIKLEAELSIAELNVGGEPYENNGAFEAGAWRLVPGQPMGLSVGLINRGSLGGTFSATLSTESPYVQVVQAIGGGQIPPQANFVIESELPTPSGWLTGFVVMAKDDIPLGVPQRMVLRLVPESGATEYAVSFNLTSFGATADVAITRVEVWEATDLVSDYLPDGGYVLEVYGKVSGYGGFIASHTEMVAGPPTMEIPTPIMRRYMGYEWTKPFFGVPDRYPLDEDGAEAVLGILMVKELPTEALTVEVRESPTVKYQATLVPNYTPWP